MYLSFICTSGNTRIPRFSLTPNVASLLCTDANEPMHFITKIYWTHYKVSWKSTYCTMYTQNKKLVETGRYTRLGSKVKLDKVCKPEGKENFKFIWF